MKLIETDHASRGHHAFGPSGNTYRDPRVGGCLGFKNREGTSQAAEEGTAAHEILDVAVRVWVKEGCVGSINDFLPSQLSDMEQASLYSVANVIEEQIRDADEVYPELMVTLRSDNGDELNYGYLDLLTIRQGEAIITDYKFGWVPVKPAQINRQGWNYAAAVFQMFPDLVEITVQFIQPKIDYISTHTFNRTQDADRLRLEIENIINQSVEVQTSKDAERMNPGGACTYCALAGTCPAYLNMFDLGRVKSAQLPEPVEWEAAAIETPEQAAAAMAWLNVFETAAKQVKQRCVEIAQEHGSIDCDGWSYKPAYRKSPAKINSLDHLYSVLEESYNISRHQLVPYMTISKSDAVKATVEQLKNEYSDKSKKQLTEEVETILKVRDVVSEGSETVYLRKTQTK